MSFTIKVSCSFLNDCAIIGGLGAALCFYNNLKLMDEGQHIELNYKEIDSLER